jgi:hypothetical protein
MQVRTITINNETFLQDNHQSINEPKIRAIEINVGTKIECRDFKLKELQENEYIKSNFKLNIKRLNRWWYSVYFDNKQE